MRLNQDHIQQLYDFTRAHFVEHYDLQTELVDHLGNGIEDQWAKNPNIPFQKALQLEFKKFGVFGFHDVIKEKTKAMEKRYWNILWGFYKEYLKPPKILMFFMTLMVVFTITMTLPEGNKGYLLVLVFVFLMGVLFVKSVQNRKYLKRKEKKWLLEEMIMNHGQSLAFINFGLQVCVHPWMLENLLQNSFFAFVTAFFLTALILLFYIMVYIIPPRMEEFLVKTYPEFKLE